MVGVTCRGVHDAADVTAAGVVIVAVDQYVFDVTVEGVANSVICKVVPANVLGSFPWTRTHSDSLVCSHTLLISSKSHTNAVVAKVTLVAMFVVAVEERKKGCWYCCHWCRGDLVLAAASLLGLPGVVFLSLKNCLHVVLVCGGNLDFGEARQCDSR